MFKHELSPFLRAVLDAVERRPDGLTLDAASEPDFRFVCRLAQELDAEPEEIRLALIGLHAGHCLMEESIEFPGIEPFVRWTVHPQCLN